MVKKILMCLFTVIMCLSLVGCGEEKKLDNNSKKESNNNQSNETANNNNNSTNNNTSNDIVIDDDEIIEFDDEDNKPIENEKIVVEKVINCDGCVYSYFSDEKSFGSTLSENEYTLDINELKTMGGKQRHNFFGLVLSDNKISRAYSCILKDKKIYCIEGSVDGRYHTNNIGILNQIFTSDQCKYISAGHTYVCTDGSYNGNTITTGYTSLHYETSCTIYGSDSKPGKMACN